MNTFFISTSTKKDLERIKKWLKRNNYEFTLNSKQLFIVFWTNWTLGYWDSYAISSNGATITPLKLHKDHPLLKQDDTENFTPLPFAQ